MAREATAANRSRGRGLLVRLAPDSLKTLRRLALDNDTTLQALAIEALNDLLQKHGRRPVVRAYSVAKKKRVRGTHGNPSYEG